MPAVFFSLVKSPAELLSGAQSKARAECKPSARGHIHELRSQMAETCLTLCWWEREEYIGDREQEVNMKVPFSIITDFI